MKYVKIFINIDGNILHHNGESRITELRSYYPEEILLNPNMVLENFGVILGKEYRTPEYIEKRLASLWREYQIPKFIHYEFTN